MKKKYLIQIHSRRSFELKWNNLLSRLTPVSKPWIFDLPKTKTKFCSSLAIIDQSLDGYRSLENGERKNADVLGYWREFWKLCITHDRGRRGDFEKLLPAWHEREY